jgi:hypothetical protein
MNHVTSAARSSSSFASARRRCTRRSNSSGVSSCSSSCRHRASTPRRVRSRSHASDVALRGARCRSGPAWSTSAASAPPRARRAPRRRGPPFAGTRGPPDTALRRPARAGAGGRCYLRRPRLAPRVAPAILPSRSCSKVRGPEGGAPRIVWMSSRVERLGRTRSSPSFSSHTISVPGWMSKRRLTSAGIDIWFWLVTREVAEMMGSLPRLTEERGRATRIRGSPAPLASGAEVGSTWVDAADGRGSRREGRGSPGWWSARCSGSR